MELAVMYGGKWKYSFQADSGADVRRGCLEGWNALRKWSADTGEEIRLTPQLMLRNTFTRFEERWVPAGYNYPGHQSSLVDAPDPFRAKDVSWDALWERIVKANQAVAASAAFLDGFG